MIVVGMVLYTLGIVFGALAICYMPKNLIEETQSNFVIVQSGMNDFAKLFKCNFVIEFLWIFAVWLFSMGKLTKGFAGLVILLRGAVVGFCVEFGFGTGNTKEIILNGIFPQCALGVPVMTLFFAICLKCAKEKRESRSESGYFILGGAYTLVTLITAFFESLAVTLFINIL